MSKVITGNAKRINISDFNAPYGVIVADPPWTYTNGKNSKGLTGLASGEYDTMTIDDICAMPVKDLAAKDGVLLLWGTFPLLPEALMVLKSWGYTYKTGFPWIKMNNNFSMPPGVGFWVRGVSEFVMIGVRGKAKPPEPKDRYIGLIAPNLKHSRKPDSVHALAETLPGPYLELFARRSRKGWDCFGNEVDKATQQQEMFREAGVHAG